MEETPSRSYEMQLRYDAGDPRQVRLASLVHALDAWNQIELIEAKPARPPNVPEPARLELVLADGQRLTGYALFRRVVRSLRLLWPLAALTFLPGFEGLARRRYPDSTSAKPSETPPAAPATSPPPQRQDAKV
jgi:hypothetical protein